MTAIRSDIRYNQTARARKAGLRGRHCRPGAGRSDHLPGCAQREGRRRDLFYLYLDRAGQAMLYRDAWVRLPVDEQFHANAAIANLAGYLRHGRANVAVLSPRKAFEAKASRLAWPDSPQRRGRR